MLLLTTTSGTIRVVTDAASTVDVTAQFVDQFGSSIAPGRQATTITTATTTVVVSSPAASTARNINTLTIVNRDASASVGLHPEFFDGTNAYRLHQKLTLAPGESLTLTETGEWIYSNAQVPQVPSWYGNLYGAYGRCDPQQLLRMAQMAGTVAATPTNITTTVARISYFRPPADIVVNKVRYYGVGATTNIYRIALYNGDTLARLTAETAFTTAANVFGEIFTGLGLTLVKDQLYFLAVSVNNTGTTAGILCMSPTVAATTGQIQVVPKSWPGNIDLDTGHMDGGFAQGAVTAGALPDPFPTVAVQAAWTGGFPLFFLDNNNA